MFFEKCTKGLKAAYKKLLKKKFHPNSTARSAQQQKNENFNCPYFYNEKEVDGKRNMYLNPSMSGTQSFPRMTFDKKRLYVFHVYISILPVLFDQAEVRYVRCPFSCEWIDQWS